MIRSQLHHLLEQQVTQCSDAPAVAYKSESITYGELFALTERVAHGLAALGVRRGDRVAVFLEKRVEAIAAIFAASLAGAVFVPINPLLRPRQVEHILIDCDVRVLVTSFARFDALVEESVGSPALEHVVLVGAPGTRVPSTSAAVTEWAELTGAAADGLLPRGIDVDLAAIFYTSGSTGKPKGVMLSHRNLIAGAESVSSYLENRSDDVILAILPLSFDAGFSQITTAFAVGAQVVLANYALAADVVRLCERHGVTGLTCVPPLWAQLAERTWPVGATTSLRYFANTGGRLPKTTLDRLRSLFPNARPFLMYGLTEAFRSTYLDPSQVDIRPDSIGKAIPNAEILVLRPDGTPCDPGEPGELVHRGALVAMGYWNDPARTAERFRPLPGSGVHGHTAEVAVWSGDTVVADDEGYLYFVGRTDDMIKTSGYRVSPTEVEEVAYGTGLVRDAVAIGVADDELGQRIVLLASPLSGSTLDEAELISLMRSSLPLYMVPSEVIVRNELPRSPNGKFDRSLIREELGR